MPDSRSVDRSRRVFAFAVLAALVMGSAAPAQEKPAADGAFVTVASPIDEKEFERLKADINRLRADPARPVKTIVFDFNPEGKDASSPNFGGPYELAKFIRDLANNGVKTVAFVRAKLTGHSVLPAIACADLVMSNDAGRLGPVVDQDSQLPEPAERKIYAEFAGRLRRGVVAKMLDKSVAIFGGTDDQGTYVYFASDDDDPTFVNAKARRPVAALPPGVLGSYTAAEATTYQLCTAFAETREQVAALYNISAGGLKADLLNGRTPKPTRIEIDDKIDDALKAKLRRQFDSVRRENENTVFLVIRRGDGDASSAAEIAAEIANLQDANGQPIRTVAVLTGPTKDLAVLLTLACSEIVMYKGEADSATLGPCKGVLDGSTAPKANIEAFRAALVETAERQRTSQLIARGFIESDLVVLRVRNSKTNGREIMTPDQVEAANDRDGKVWVVESTIKEKGELLELKAQTAKEFGIASRLIATNDPADALKSYGFDPKAVRTLESHWLDSVAAFLRRWEISALLIIIGIGGVIMELKAPGLAVPGIVAAICFVLFFWSQSKLSGDIVYLAVLLFILGIALMGVEIFILPGFGVCGISGILLLLTGLVLATVDKVPQTTEEWRGFGMGIIEYGLTFAGGVSLAFLFARFLPKIPYANRIMLKAPVDSGDGGEPLANVPGAEKAALLLGRTGTALSMLRPAGSARFGDIITDVVSEGGYIAAETAIVVVEVEGNRIVVAPAR